MDARIVFMGSPDFALPTLRNLDEYFNVVGVLTQPDRPAGRGRSLKPPPVKTLADELGLAILQPPSLKEPAAMEGLKAWSPDIIVVAAFGQILRQEVLELPRYGCLNVHASLLPRWRGAAPIQAAILHGDTITGVTIMKMDRGVDTGPLLSQRNLQIQEQETAGSLSTKLAKLGAELLVETLPVYLAGELEPRPQEGEASYAPMLKKADGELDLQRNAEALVRKIRAYDPWPGTFIPWEDGRLKILQARAADIPRIAGSKPTSPGERIIVENQPGIITAEGVLILERLQPAGKKPMPGEVFLHGARNWQP